MESSGRGRGRRRGIGGRVGNVKEGERLSPSTRSSIAHDQQRIYTHKHTHTLSYPSIATIASASLASCTMAWRCDTVSLVLPVIRSATCTNFTALQWSEYVMLYDAIKFLYFQVLLFFLFFFFFFVSFIFNPDTTISLFLSFSFLVFT